MEHEEPKPAEPVGDRALRSGARSAVAASALSAGSASGGGVSPVGGVSRVGGSPRWTRTSAPLPLDEALRLAVARRADRGAAGATQSILTAGVLEGGRAAASVRLLQRVNVKPLKVRKSQHPTDTEAERRTTLIALDWQVILHAVDEGSLEQKRDVRDKIAELLDSTQTPSHGDIKTLIAAARALGTVQDVVPPDKKKLTSTQLALVDVAIIAAKERVATTIGSEDALCKAFAGGHENAAIVQSAIENYAMILKHIALWRSHRRIRYDETATSFGASNQGLEEDSLLTLGSTAFSREFPLPDVLVHEASHGCLGTMDIAYGAAPFFFELTGNAALANATHYEYAIALAHDEHRFSSKPQAGKKAPEEESAPAHHDKRLSSKRRARKKGPEEESAPAHHDKRLSSKRRARTKGPEEESAPAHHDKRLSSKRRARKKPSDEEILLRAISLTWFRANKIWGALMATRNTYDTKTLSIDADVLEHHRRILGFNAARPGKSVHSTKQLGFHARREHIQSLIEFFALAKGYFTGTFQITETVSDYTLVRHKGHTLSVQESDIRDKSADEISNRLLVRYAEVFPHPAAADPVAFGAWLFDHSFVQGSLKATDTDIAVYQQLGGSHDIARELPSSSSKRG
jgi:hypothetical protein